MIDRFTPLKSKPLTKSIVQFTATLQPMLGARKKARGLRSEDIGFSEKTWHKI